MLLIYCATPSRLKHKVGEIMDFVTKQGYGPFHPFQAFELERFEDGPIGRGKTMEFCLRAISICDEFWIFGVSEGTLIELSHVIKNLDVTVPRPKIRVFPEFDLEWEQEYTKLKDRFGDPLSKIWTRLPHNR